MLLDQVLPTDSQGHITAAKSEYLPEGEEKDRLVMLRDHLQIAYSVRNKPYREFNDVSLIDRMNLDQLSWGQYVEPPSMDPDEAWRSRCFRPIVRNKIISIAAHITASVIAPMIVAQNADDEEDRDAAGVMRDIMEWVNDRSDYDKTFIYAVLGALFNPAAFVYTEFGERFRAEREKGKEVKWVLDELMSGIKDFIVPCDEIWIPNAYESDIQKQSFVIWRRIVSYEDSLARYGKLENFKKFVRPGLQVVMGEDALWYESYDKSLENRYVEEVIYWNRTEDLRLVMVNGVLVSDPNEPNPRKDKFIPIAKFGYELIDDGRFFWYKSLAFKLANDEEVINTAYRMVVDGSYLQLMPPSVAFGVDTVGSGVMIPGSVTTFDNVENPNASFQPINTGNNLAAGYNLLSKVESSVSESSSDVLQSGQAPAGAETAYEISRLEQNARVMLGLFGKMVSFAVKDWGLLKVGDIVQHLTVGQVMDIESPSGRLKFHKFLLPDRKVDGKSKSKLIEFDMSLPDEMTEEELMVESRKVQKRESKSKDSMELIRVNPTLFRKLRYMVRVRAEAIMPKSEAMERALKLQAYGLAAANPITNKEAITRDFLFGAFPDSGDADKYIQKPQETAMAGMQGAAPQGMGAALRQTEGAMPDMQAMTKMLG